MALSIFIADEDDTLAKMRKFQDNLKGQAEAAVPNQSAIAQMLAEAKKKIASKQKKTVCFHTLKYLIT